MISLILGLVIFGALEASALKIHERQCGKEKDCRVNVVTVKKDLKARCTGSLFGELSCSLDLKKGDAGADLKILCLDRNSVAHLDATVPMESYAYRVTKTSAANGANRLKIDPATYFAFEHPAFKGTLSKNADGLRGEMFLLMNKTEHRIDEVNCATSESATSSAALVQTESPF